MRVHHESSLCKFVRIIANPGGCFVVVDPDVVDEDDEALLFRLVNSVPLRYYTYVHKRFNEAWPAELMMSTCPVDCSSFL